jgi:uncharacterized protein (UPF0264 family)
VETLDAAIELGCAGLLVDTFTKTGAGLFGCCDPAFLRALARRANDANLLFALAGRLTLADAPHLAAVGGDVVGIRSAACRGSERTGPVDPDAIRDFRAALEAAAGARLTSRT